MNLQSTNVANKILAKSAIGLTSFFCALFIKAGCLRFGMGLNSYFKTSHKELTYTLKVLDMT